MNNYTRTYIKPITRKNKKKTQDKKANSEEENNFGFSYNENDSEEFQTLIDDFNGKCILLPNTQDSDNNEGQQKKNKLGENEFQYLNQFQNAKPISVEIKQEQIQQNLDQDDYFSLLDSKSNLSEYENDEADYLIVKEGEINYLEGLLINRKNIIQKQQNLIKQKKKKINKKLLTQNIQSKKIVKVNKKA